MSRLEWPGMVSEYTHAADSRDVTVTRPFQVGVGFSGHRDMVRESAGRVVRFDARPGAVYVTGHHPIAWLDVRGAVEALEVYLDLDELERLTGHPVELRPTFAVDDGTVFAVATRLRGAHLGLVAVSDIEASTLTHRLRATLTRSYSGRRAPPPEPAQLSAAAVRTVVDYVHANLARTLTLDVLAGAVFTSPFHFARGFTSATGMPPHAFVTAVRMTVARDLLTRNPVRVADAAAAVGFTNVGHFRRVFRRHHGVDPGQVRAGR